VSTSTGTVETLAGGGAAGGSACGFANGVGSAALFSFKRSAGSTSAGFAGLAVIGSSALYVADTANAAIRRIDTATGDVAVAGEPGGGVLPAGSIAVSPGGGGGVGAFGPSASASTAAVVLPAGVRNGSAALLTGAGVSQHFRVGACGNGVCELAEGCRDELCSNAGACPAPEEAPDADSASVDGAASACPCGH
jgi:hypothetical protein